MRRSFLLRKDNCPLEQLYKILPEPGCVGRSFNSVGIADKVGCYILSALQDKFQTRPLLNRKVCSRNEVSNKEEVSLICLLRLIWKFLPVLRKTCAYILHKHAI